MKDKPIFIVKCPICECAIEADIIRDPGMNLDYIYFDCEECKLRVSMRKKIR